MAGLFDDTQPPVQPAQPVQQAPAGRGLPIKGIFDDTQAEDIGDFKTGLKGGIESAKAMAGGATALGGMALSKVPGLGIPGRAVAEYGMGVFEEHQEESAKYAPKQTLKQLCDDPSIGGVADWSQYTFGSLVPSMAEAAVGAVVGGAIGTSAAPGPGTAVGALGGAVSKTAVKSGMRHILENYAKKRLVKEVAEKGIDSAVKTAAKTLGAKTGVVLTTAQMESGGMFGEDVERRGLEEANVTSAAGLGLLAGSVELFGGNIAIIDKMLGSGAAKKATEALAKGNLGYVSRLFRESLTNVPQEMMQEGAQAVLSIANRFITVDDEKWDTEENWEVIESMAAGALPGLGGALVKAGFKGKTGEDPVIKPQEPKGPIGKAAAAGGVGPFVARGLPSTAAQSAVEFAKTPETEIEKEAGKRAAIEDTALIDREKREKELEQTLSTLPTEEQVEAEKVAAGEIAAADPIHDLRTEIRRQGGLNLESLKVDYDNETTKAMISKLPGIISKTGKVHFDEIADEAKSLGFGSADELVTALASVGTKKEAAAKGKAELQAKRDFENRRNEEVDHLVSKGFDPVFDKKPAVDLNKGDVVITKATEGLPADEYVVKGIDADGKVILEDGVTRKVDAFDLVDIRGVKRSGKEGLGKPEKVGAEPSAAVPSPEPVTPSPATSAAAEGEVSLEKDIGPEADNIYMNMPMDRVKADADKGVSLAKKALRARTEEKAGAIEPTSIDKERAETAINFDDITAELTAGQKMFLKEELAALEEVVAEGLNTSTVEEWVADFKEMADLKQKWRFGDKEFGRDDAAAIIKDVDPSGKFGIIYDYMQGGRFAFTVRDLNGKVEGEQVGAKDNDGTFTRVSRTVDTLSSEALIEMLKKERLSFLDLAPETLDNELGGQIREQEQKPEIDIKKGRRQPDKDRQEAGPTGPPEKQVAQEVTIPPELEEPPLSTETFEKAVASAKNVGQAVKWLADNSNNESYREIANRIRPFIDDTDLVIISPGKEILGGVPRAMNISTGLFHYSSKTGRKVVFLKDKGFDDHGLYEETLLHEAIHAATLKRINEGNWVASRGTTLHAAVQDLYDLQNVVVAHLDKKGDGATEYEKKLTTQMSVSSSKELVAYGLTDPEFQKMLADIPYNGGTVWSEFVEAIRRILGVSPEARNALTEVLRVTDAILAGSIDKTVEEVKPLETETIDNKKSIAHGQEVNTSPSEAMKEAENYKKAHVLVDGLEISVENPVGSERSGTDDDGKTWSQVMKSDYGYFKGTVGFDKDHVDVFLKPSYTGGKPNVHVVNQNNADGSFDEHKVVMGATSSKDALLVYNSNYEKGWTGAGTVVEMPLADFQKWVKSGAPGKGEVKQREYDLEGKRKERRSDLVNESGEFRRQGDVSADKLSELQEDEQGNPKKLDFKDPVTSEHVAATQLDDVVEEFTDSKKARITSAKRAQELLKESPEYDGFYIEMDLANLGGMNESLGNSAADIIYKKIGTAVAKNLDKLDATSDKFRHGGDELSGVVVGKGLSREQVESAMYDAVSDIHDLVTATKTLAGGKLSEVEHTKHPGEARHRGVNINFAVKQLSDKVKVEESISTADKLLELRKKWKEEDDGYRIKISQIRGIDFGDDIRDGEPFPEGQPDLREEVGEVGERKEVPAEVVRYSDPEANDTLPIRPGWETNLFRAREYANKLVDNGFLDGETAKAVWSDEKALVKAINDAVVGAEAEPEKRVPPPIEKPKPVPEEKPAEVDEDTRLDDFIENSMAQLNDVEVELKGVLETTGKTISFKGKAGDALKAANERLKAFNSMIDCVGV